MVGNGDRILLEEETEAEPEKLCALELPRIEIESARTLSGGGLMRLPGSAVLSLDIPGRRMLPILGFVADGSST